MRYLPFIIEIGLVVYCLIDCITTDSILVRNLQKPMWVVLIVFLPVIGSVAWLVAGRPQPEQRPRTVPWPATATSGYPEYERPRPPRGPDDDPTFLSKLDRPADDVAPPQPPSTPPAGPEDDPRAERTES